MYIIYSIYFKKQVLTPIPHIVPIAEAIKLVKKYSNIIIPYFKNRACIELRLVQARQGIYNSIPKTA